MSEVALVAIQVRIGIDDYASPEAFRRRVGELADRAAAAAQGAEQRLFVFPEAIGHFVPLAFAPGLSRRLATTSQAIAAIAALRPWRVVAGMRAAGTLDPRAGLLREVTGQSDALMRDCFATVAARHRATVVAGSHLRPVGPRLRNSSYAFAPTGELLGVTDKINLVPFYEDSRPGGLGLEPGSPEALPVYETPWGRLATLICYDGFREPHTSDEDGFCAAGAVVDRARAVVVANPAANPWDWQGPWHFAEVGEDILRREQWRTEGLPATLAELDCVRYGVTAHLCGGVFDQSFEGRSEILARRGRDVDVLAEAESHTEDAVVAARVAMP